MTTARAFLSALAFSFGALLAPGAGYGADPAVLTLNNPNEPPYSFPDGSGFVDVVAGEAFRRIGVQLRLVRLPAERGLINANTGTEDGDVTRIAGLDASYPNLVRVPEKLIDWEFTAFGKKTTPPPTSETMRTRAFGYIRGWKIYEKHLADSPFVVAADDSSQLFRLLQLNRVELVFYERYLGLSLMKRHDIKGVMPLEPLVAKREMYIYLNKRHAALVPKLAEALRAIKSEGLYDRLYREKVLSLAMPAR